MKYRVVNKGGKHSAQVSEDNGESWHNIREEDYTAQKIAENICRWHKEEIEQRLSDEVVVWIMEE